MIIDLYIVGIIVWCSSINNGFSIIWVEYILSWCLGEVCIIGIIEVYLYGVFLKDNCIVGSNLVGCIKEVCYFIIV